MFLSVCIPTYNRAAFLRQNLERLASQAAADIEIVVSDNGSNDETVRTVSEFRAAFPTVSIRFFRNDENLGFDRNVIKLVPESRGEYVWLLGDDDFVYPEAIAKIRDEVSAHPSADLFLVNYSRRDVVTGALTSKRMIDRDEDFVAENFDDFFFEVCARPSYFKLLGTNLITMSANVFRRRAWLDAGDLRAHIGTNMIHVFALTTILRRSTQAVFIARPLVEYLCNNHRPWGNDVWKDYQALVYGHLDKLGFSRERLDRVRNQSVNYVGFREKLKNALRIFEVRKT